MPLVKSTLEQAIKAALDNVSQVSIDPETARANAAALLATAIDNYIKSGTVTVTVATTGTATAQAGTGNGSIS